MVQLSASVVKGATSFLSTLVKHYVCQLSLIIKVIYKQCDDYEACNPPLAVEEVICQGGGQLQDARMTTLPEWQGIGNCVYLCNVCHHALCVANPELLWCMPKALPEKG